MKKHLAHLLCACLFFSGCATFNPGFDADFRQAEKLTQKKKYRQKPSKFFFRILRRIKDPLALVLTRIIALEFMFL